MLSSTSHATTLLHAEQIPLSLIALSVIDMQPIDPPIGGGRQRLLGLYHGLGSKINARYIGSYDWPGEIYREHTLSETLVEIDVPLSEVHHHAAKALAAEAGTGVVIDIAFSLQANLSPDYLAKVRSEIAKANVVIFSHPWVYPLVCDDLREDQLVIYDSQNVEGYLRSQFLDRNNPTQKKLLEQVCRDESDLGARANWILACSHQDLQRFYRIYGFSPAKMRVVPNGAMAFTPERHISVADRTQARLELGLESEKLIAIFVGSSYGPNIDAAYFIAQDLAVAMSDIRFVIAGGVSEQINSGLPNVTLTGTLSEEQKYQWLRSADFALNPIFSGSGTNIKMFDFMASSLPVITTAVGARGIESSYQHAMIIADPSVSAFNKAIMRLGDVTYRKVVGNQARSCVEEGYAWERISNQLGKFIEMRTHTDSYRLPKFSVVIPSYERPDHLTQLITSLQHQTERDFEVVVVDQSAKPWEGAQEDYGFVLNYYFTPIKGAVRARNTGAMLAQGEILAFIDDDCLPNPDWLLNSRRYFANPKVVGVEGQISSDHLDDSNWRPVSNVGSEGVGFMTANLLVRSSVFQYLGGFDLEFDRPHFREDTDFGWRMLDLGEVPHASDVGVFHPAQRRDIERESHETRAHFFQKDVLLYKKHPKRYKMLFEFERHYERTQGFKEHVLCGFEERSVEVPAWMRKKLS